MTTLQQLALFVTVELQSLKNVLQGPTVAKALQQQSSVMWERSVLQAQGTLGNANSSNSYACNGCDG
jgi:hypothetical protein